MNKRDALKLKRGDRIFFGASMQTAGLSGDERAGVRHVTPKGRIQILEDRASLHIGFHVTSVDQWTSQDFEILKI